MKVRDAMTAEPTCCTPETSLEAAARMMREHDCGALPVVDDLVNKIPIGLVTDRDIVTRAIAAGKNPLELTVRDCMTAPAITVMSGSSLGDCVEMLEVNQIRRAIVVDARGHVAGMLAQADIAAHVSRRKAGELIREISQPTVARAIAQ